MKVRALLGTLRAALLSAAFAPVIAAAGAPGAGAGQGSGPSPAEPAAVRHFEEKVRPLLEAHCFECHGRDPDKVKGGLNLASRAGALRGGDLGPVIVPGKPDESLLLKAVRYADDKLQMPPKRKLPQADIDTLAKWVESGAAWTPGEQRPAAAPAAAPYRGVPVDDEARRFWSYQPVARPAVPEVAKKGWVQTPVDAFILQKLEQKGLEPAPPADKAALLRRAYYDLTGLPPTPAEVDAFVADAAPDAYEKVVDRLLASPHYGEKWGRHWLDLVRYADTNGYERDSPKPFAWRFRDYVIRSFNDDKPYDQFLKEQLAGDDLPDGETTADSVVATGYYRLGVWDDDAADKLQAKFDELDDVVSTTAQAMLGMTAGCARCHNHKIDPMPQADYYRLAAFFADLGRYDPSTDPNKANSFTDVGAPAFRAAYEQDLRRREGRRAELEVEMTRIENAAIVRMPAEDQRASEGPDRPAVVSNKLKQFATAGEWAAYEGLKREFDELAKVPEPPRELALSVNNCPAEPPATHVMVRGSPHAPGEKVDPGFPLVLGVPDPAIAPPVKGAKTSGRRRALAEWVASPSNPLTARVMANRIWQHHFGRGIVRTPSDFGKAGDRPTHPELLDWLASEFVSGGWRLKPMHRLLMTSSAYRMASRDDPAAAAKDPANDSFWKFDPRRLTAEEIRDSILAVNGTINLKMSGPGVYTEVPEAVLATASRPKQAWGVSPPEERTRRSVYVFVKRSLVEPVLGTFDSADTDGPCPVRFSTTVPTQALTGLNSDFMNQQAAAFAARLRREAGPDPAARARLALRLALCRPASEEQVSRALILMTDLREKHGLSEDKALDAFCLMALNLNEFVYLD